MIFPVFHLGAFAVFEAITFAAFIQIWDIIMYLTNKFKAKIERIKAESEAVGEASGRAEGEASGRAKAHQASLDWYRRRESAIARGVPFNEPPPFLKGDKIEQ